MLPIRPFLSFFLTYLNHLISKPPPAPPESSAKSREQKQDTRFVAVASIAIGLSQSALVASSISEMLVLIVAYRSSPISSYILSLLVWTFSDAPTNISVPPSAWVAWAIGVSGCLLRYQSINTLGNLFTYQLVIRDNHTLITTGPYSFIRHPGYAGSILAAVGSGLYFLGPGSYAYECGLRRTTIGIAWILVWIAWKLFMIVNVVRRTKSEDAFLKAEFGQAWVNWSEKVPYRLVPGIY